MEKNEPQDVPFEVVRAEPAEATPFHASIGLLTPEMIARAEAAVEGVKKVKAIALRVTSYTDWTRLGGKGYLNEGGCKKLANLWGVSFRDAKVRSEDRVVAGEPVREFIAEVTAEFQGRVVTEIGTCDSEYDFWKSQGKDAQGNKIKIPFGERDFASMRKHAYTNAYARALKACIGIGTVPWEEVEAALGASAGKATDVAFDKGGTAPRKAAPTVATAEAGDVRRKLWQMAFDMANGEQAEAEAIIERASSFAGKDGKTFSFKDPQNPKVSDKWIASTYGKVKKEWEPTFGGPPEEPGANG